MTRFFLFCSFAQLLFSNASFHEKTTHFASRQKQVSKNKAQEEQMIDLIANLPEVKEERKYFFKTTRRHILITLENDPQKDGFYRVSVVQDMVDHYFHLWYFEVNPKNHAVSFWDIPSDTNIPYSKWSKRIKSSNGIYMR